MIDHAKTLVWCDRALLLGGATSVVVGILLLVATGTSLFTAYDSTVAQAFYGEATLPAAVIAHHRWLLGIIGASVVGWGMAFIALVVGPFRRRELWAWRTLAWSVGVWAVLDAGSSLVHGVDGEVVFVAVIGAAIAVPLALSRRAFARS